MWKAVLVSIFLMFAGFVPASHADTYYKVTISNVTFDGTNACGGECIERLNGSFELDVFGQPDLLDARIVPSSISFTASGPLGTLNCCSVNFSQYYIAISSPSLGPHGGSADEFDIDAIANTGPSGGTGTGQAGIYMYACQSAVCVADFTSSIGTPCFNCAIGPSSGIVTFSVISAPVSTPEPTTLALLLLSIPALLFWASRSCRLGSGTHFLSHSRSVEPRTSVTT